MGFASQVPQAPLCHWIDAIWDWQGAVQPNRLERVLPVANAGVIINLAQDQTRVYDEQRRCHYYSSMTLDGPRNRSAIIDTDEQQATMGVIFRPGAAAAFFRQRMDTLVNASAGLEDLAGSDAVLLRESLLEAAGAAQRMGLLLRWLSSRAPETAPDRVVSRLLAALDAQPGMSALQATTLDLGLSRRMLGERFRQAVGLSPKRYLRLQRFHRVIAAGNAGNGSRWADLSLDCGYADQAHMAHEFREFCGMTPSDYRQRRGAWDGHVAAD